MGTLTDLPLVSERRDNQGRTVRRVRHDSGAIIEYTLSQAGEILNTRVISRGDR